MGVLSGMLFFYKYIWNDTFGQFSIYLILANLATSGVQFYCPWNKGSRVNERYVLRIKNVQNYNWDLKKFAGKLIFLIFGMTNIP